MAIHKEPSGFVAKLIKINMVIKRFFSFFILLLAAILFSPEANAQKVRKVVIDAGHGGHDPGAVGKISKEKDITLSIALKTGKFIEENLPDVKVIYTRKTDVFVELYRRAKIANEAKADLFISIHCNANKSSTPYGAETYVMGLHRSDANLSVAQTENASILLEEDYHVQYDGFDPTSPEGYIFFSMLQNAYMDQSLGLASNVQKHFKERVNLFDRGVKQAGFLVLYKTTMPSVLIETGFISNLKEEKTLASEEGQTYIASAIYRAIKEYKQSMERSIKLEVADELKSEKPIEKDTSGKKEKAKSKQIKDQEVLLAQKDLNSAQTIGITEPSDRNLVFKVQFLVSDKQLDSSDRLFKGLKNVEYYIHGGLYKYTYGSEKNFEAADIKAKELRRSGFSDCFVVAFLNEQRIDINEARKLQLTN